MRGCECVCEWERERERKKEREWERESIFGKHKISERQSGGIENVSYNNRDGVFKKIILITAAIYVAKIFKEKKKSFDILQ